MCDLSHRQLSKLMMLTTNASVRHCWLPYWLRLGGHDAPDDDPGKLKDCVTRLGINSRTWKLYAEYGDRLFQTGDADTLPGESND